MTLRARHGRQAPRRGTPRISTTVRPARCNLPYQLWTGARWDGSAEGPCMHEADSRFEVNGTSSTRIRGPVAWSNPRTGERHTVWERSKDDGSKAQYFTCHETGIGRVYDSRGPRYYESGRCKFPAGYGWQVGTRRSCRSTAIEITRIGLDDTATCRSCSSSGGRGRHSTTSTGTSPATDDARLAAGLTGRGGRRGRLVVRGIRLAEDQGQPAGTMGHQRPSRWRSTYSSRWGMDRLIVSTRAAGARSARYRTSRYGRKLSAMSSRSGWSRA